MSNSPTSTEDKSKLNMVAKRRFWKTFAVCHIIALVVVVAVVTTSGLPDQFRPADVLPGKSLGFMAFLGFAHMVANILGAIVGGLLAFDAKDGGVIYKLRTS